MLCLSGFERYSRWLPLNIYITVHSVTLDHYHCVIMGPSKRVKSHGIRNLLAAIFEGHNFHLRSLGFIICHSLLLEVR